MAQNDYHGCLATKQGKIPTALVTTKTGDTNYPETPRKCQIKLQIQNSAWWILFKYCIIPIRCFWFSISTKHWNKSLMFHPIFFFTPCSEGPCPCPYPLPCPYATTASVVSKTPSSTLQKNISPWQMAASTSKMPKDAAEEGDGYPPWAWGAECSQHTPLPCPALPRGCRSSAEGMAHGKDERPLGPSSIQ